MVQPVHATGRYMNHTLLDFLKNDFGIHGYGMSIAFIGSRCSPHGPCPDIAGNLADMSAVNRLDRLTSGLMILALSSKASRDLANEFQNREVKKEYVARVRGCFPEYVYAVGLFSLTGGTDHLQPRDAVRASGIVMIELLIVQGRDLGRPAFTVGR